MILQDVVYSKMTKRVVYLVLLKVFSVLLYDRHVSLTIQRAHLSMRLNGENNKNDHPHMIIFSIIERVPKKNLLIKFDPHSMLVEMVSFNRRFSVQKH